MSQRSQIVACYTLCNEEDTIGESIRSIKAYVDRFVVIDSAFTSNPLESTHSTDKTRQIVERICAAPPACPLTYLEPATKLTQVEARNLYLRQVLPPDWVFVVDGDEVLYGDHEKILRILEDIRSGEILRSLSIPVYTIAVNLEKMADTVTREEYETTPLVATMGYMPRLFAAASNLRYTVEVEMSTPALTFLGPKVMKDGVAVKEPDEYLIPWRFAYPGELFLINHHTRQSYEGYQSDYEWETKGVLHA